MHQITGAQQAGPGCRAEPHPLPPLQRISQPKSRRAQEGTILQGWAQPQAGRARCSHSYKPKQGGSLASCRSSHLRVRPALKVTLMVLAAAYQPLRPTLSCTGTSRAQGMQLGARLQELSFHLSSFSLVSTKLPHTRAHFPSTCLRQSFLLAKRHQFPKLSYLLGTGEERGLRYGGHQRRVQGFNLVPVSSRRPPARGTHACPCSRRQGRNCRAYSKCRRRRLPGNNRNKEGAIFDLATC